VQTFKDIKSDPYVVISHGGAQGGWNTQVFCVQDCATEDGVLHGQGFVIPDGMRGCNHLYWAEEDTLSILSISGWPQERVRRLEQAWEAGEREPLDGAGQYLPVTKIQSRWFSASGHWMLVGPVAVRCGVQPARLTITTINHQGVTA